MCKTICIEADIVLRLLVSNRCKLLCHPYSVALLITVALGRHKEGTVGSGSRLSIF